MNGRRLSGFDFFPLSGKFFEGSILKKVSSKVNPRAVVTGLVAVFLFLAFLLLWQRHQMIRIGYQIEQLRQERTELLRIRKELLIETESLSALDRIERIATDQLKMKQALPQQRVYIKQPTQPTPFEGNGSVKKAP